MNRVKKILICLLGALALNAASRADDAFLPGNPYAPVVLRNIFGLNPPVPFDASQASDPPPKITPNGIMNIFGQLQALFKVASPPKAGRVGDQSYILAEGQRQDDIEVTHIDEKAGIITFNNHGQEQKLPLVAAAAGSMPAPAVTSIPMPMIGGPRGNNGANGGNGFNTRFGGRGRNLTGMNPDAGLRSIPTRGGNTDSGIQLSPEAQVILIEKNRMDTQQQVDAGLLPPLPPTALTPPDATGVGGNPLIAPLPPPP